MSSSVSVAPIPVPEKGSWRWCAENYLNNIWWKMDRQFTQQFSGTVTCSILDDLCRKYGVARTIPGMFITKYQPLADALNRHAGTVFTRIAAAQRTVLTRDDVPLIVEGELTAAWRIAGAERFRRFEVHHDCSLSGSTLAGRARRRPTDNCF